MHRGGGTAAVGELNRALPYRRQAKRSDGAGQPFR